MFQTRKSRRRMSVSTITTEIVSVPSTRAIAAPLGLIATVKPGSTVTLNPQPLPPGETVSLNPQPLPPGERVSLNPQPLPPGESLFVTVLISD